MLNNCKTGYSATLFLTFLLHPQIILLLFILDICPTNQYIQRLKFELICQTILHTLYVYLLHFSIYLLPIAGKQEGALEITLVLLSYMYNILSTLFTVHV